MNITHTALRGVARVETTRTSDPRGDFARLFCEDELRSLIGTRRIVQINESRTVQVGAVRGMHFQRPPHAEMKLVRCIQGKVWDVAVDLRAGSPTFLRWHAEELSADNARMLVIPEGVAHGFQVLEPESRLLYLHTATYRPDAEGGVRHDDPRLAIAWPLEARDLSPRDASHAPIAAGFTGLVA
jgi:dTDP-4-dehydrorhamnose 3,5-epimerase